MSTTAKAGTMAHVDEYMARVEAAAADDYAAGWTDKRIDELEVGDVVRHRRAGYRVVTATDSTAMRGCRYIVLEDEGGTLHHHTLRPDHHVRVAPAPTN